MCGATNYPSSLGGPAICPSCDCGHPPQRAAAAGVYSPEVLPIVAAFTVESIKNERERCARVVQNFARGLAACEDPFGESVSAMSLTTACRALEEAARRILEGT
jgi:hypothetical protein